MHKRIIRTVFNVYDLLLEIEGFFIPQFRAKGLEFITDFSKSKLDQWIESDRMRLAQILTNLLSNAKKFTDAGHVELFASIGDGQLIFRITDTGVGMSDDQKTKIFKEFTRLPNAQGQEGVGLGLSIVSKIVDCLNGQVWIDSKPGQGSQFTVQIPIKLLSSKEIGEINSTEIRFPEGTCILLLDDDKIQLKLTALMLRKYGAEVVTCNTTDEVFIALKSKSYSLLITDIQMPEMDGFKFLNLLRSCNIDTFKTIPVLAMSARTFIDETKFVEAGFIGVLKKPFQAIDVINKLEVVENTSLREEVQCGFNLDDLQEFVGSDKQALDSILETFVTDAIEQSEALNLAIKSEDWQQVAAIAHKLLPLVKILGEVKLSQLLSLLDSDRIDFDTFETAKLALTQLKGLTDKIRKYLKTK